ncbi:hypothetical protein ABTN04_19190, partial [Acinetobacter baumannii]
DHNLFELVLNNQEDVLEYGFETYCDTAEDVAASVAEYDLDDEVDIDGEISGLLRSREGGWDYDCNSEDSANLWCYRDSPISFINYHT